MLLDFPAHRIWQLHQLKKRYRLILMSNTNETHLAAIQKKMGRLDYKNFTGAFEAVYYSHEQGMRKPESRFFEHILQQHNLSPNEVLFVEDTPENLVPAKALGIKTYLHERNAEFKPALDKVLLALRS
jgi:putative hydrolase of the HAD superfamily